MGKTLEIKKVIPANGACPGMIEAGGIQFDKIIFVRHTFPFKGKDGMGMGFWMPDYPALALTHS